MSPRLTLRPQEGSMFKKKLRVYGENVRNHLFKNHNATICQIIMQASSDSVESILNL